MNGGVFFFFFCWLCVYWVLWDMGFGGFCLLLWELKWVLVGFFGCFCFSMVIMDLILVCLVFYSRSRCILFTFDGSYLNICYVLCIYLCFMDALESDFSWICLL